MTTATIWLEAGQVWIGAPWNEKFIAELKAMVPPACRGWDKAKKVWKCDLRYAMGVLDLAKAHFDKVNAAGVEQKEDPKPPPPRQPVSRGKGSPYQRLIEYLDDGTLKKIYRLAIQSVHPDRAKELGLDEKQLTLISQHVNAAWDEIQKGRE